MARRKKDAALDAAGATGEHACPYCGFTREVIPEDRAAGTPAKVLAVERVAMPGRVQCLCPRCGSGWSETPAVITVADTDGVE